MGLETVGFYFFVDLHDYLLHKFLQKKVFKRFVRHLISQNELNHLWTQKDTGYVKKPKEWEKD